MIDESNFINPYSINIFCDASMQGTKGCYGAIAFKMYREIDSLYKICTDTTSNNSEIKAIRNGIEIALFWKYNFKYINIFSDSQISIFGIRDRIFSWKKNNGKKLLYGSNNRIIQSQDIFLEIMQMIINNNLHINFYHQKGHVNVNNLNSLKYAEHSFKASNGLRDDVDFNLIKYISIQNNKVDNRTRKILKSQKYIPDKYDGIVSFIGPNFEDEKEEYNKLIKNNIIINREEIN